MYIKHKSCLEFKNSKKKSGLYNWTPSGISWRKGIFDKKGFTVTLISRLIWSDLKDCYQWFKVLLTQK